MAAKKKFAVFCAVLAAAWTIFALSFPMETFSLFFASNIGSMVLLLLMGTVITGPLVLLFSYVMQIDLLTLPMTLMNTVLLTVFINLYSIFRYDRPYLLMISAAVHLAALAACFIFASPMKAGKKNAKKKKTVKRGKSSKENIEKLPRITAAFVFSMVSYFFYMLIFNILLNTFAIAD